MQIRQARDPIDKIKHIVIIVQTERTVENLFFDYPNAGTVKFGYGSKGQKIPIRQVSLATHWDFVHRPAQFFMDCNGKGPKRGQNCRMNGFSQEPVVCNKPPCHLLKYPAYAYVAHDQIQPYFDIAKQYVLAARMFASNFDGGYFESLQYIIEAQDHDTIGGPSGVPGCGGGPSDWIETIDKKGGYGGRIHPCFNNTTLGDELDAARLSWAYYAARSPYNTCGKGSDGDDVTKGRVFGFWTAYWAIKHICYGPDWNNDIVSPPKRFLTDVKNGELRTVSWVTPTFQNSDRGGNDSDTGPSWVASLVNAVGESKSWNSTAIFIFWDSFGGWYDPMPPPLVDEDGLGFRVPLLIISPYAKQGYVSQVLYEHGSILRFIEDRFGLGQLAASDTRATSPAKNCFDFSMPPRKFVPIKAKYPEKFFLDQPVDTPAPGTDRQTL